MVNKFSSARGKSSLQDYSADNIKAHKGGPLRENHLIPPYMPGGRFSLLLAITSYLVCLLAGLLVALHGTISEVDDQLNSEIIIFVNSPQSGQDDISIQKLQSLVSDIKEVQSTEVVSSELNRQMLKEWLGDNTEYDTALVPQALELAIESGLNDYEFNLVLSKIHKLLNTYSNVEVIDNYRWGRSIDQTMIKIVMLGLYLISLICAVTVFTTISGAKSVYYAVLPTLNVISMVGGSDKYIRRLLSYNLLRGSYYGALFGGVFALVCYTSVPVFLYVLQDPEVKNLNDTVATFVNIYSYAAVVAALILNFLVYYLTVVLTLKYVLSHHHRWK